MNVKARSQLATALVIGALTAGCSSTPKPVQSGYLDNYKQLKPLANYPQVLAYKAEQFDDEYLQAVSKVHVKPFEVWLDSNNLKGVNLEQIGDFILYFQQQLQQQLGQHYQVVAVPDEQTLVIEGAFTKAKTQSPDLSAADILPFKIVMNAGNAAYLTATGQKNLVSEVAIEVKFSQGGTEQLLLAMAANKVLDVTVKDDPEANASAVKQVLNEWAINFAKHIGAAKQG